ncbi:MAG: AtpZ/AtpI family protein [Bacteroidetes bacterium]|nr:AtpZ/AtpI family protein [Bacteroidota bacterium]
MKKNQSPNSKRSSFNALRYSGLAFQMMALILVGVFGGMELDKFFNTSFPLFTLSLSLLSIFASIYFLVKDLTRK